MKNFRDYEKVLLPTTRDALELIGTKGAEITIKRKGKKQTLIDASSQVGTNVLGFRHPQLMSFVREYFSQKNNAPIIVAGNDSYHPSQKKLAKKLTGMYPGKTRPGDLKTYYCNSGSEAVERGCLKAAAIYKQGSSFIAFLGAFHGRTFLALSSNFSKSRHKKKMNVLSRTLPAPFGRKPNTYTPEDQWQRSIDFVRELIIHEGAEKINAIIAEPVQGEGGYIFPHKDFFPALRELATEHDIPLIADEVQAAIRTGKWFAIENYKTSPDMIPIAKAFSGGITPFGAAIIKKKFATSETGEHSSTFGGSPFSCEIALETIRIIEREKLLKNAKVLGKQFGDQIRPLEQHPIIKEVRGLGLMWAVEFQKKNGSPDPKRRDRTLNRMEKQGVYTISCGNDELNPTIRFLMPVTITDTQIAKIADALIQAVKS